MSQLPHMTSDSPSESDQPLSVVTVDGPSGAGKGTLSVALAAHLGWHFLDSGALYRLVGWQALEQEAALDDQRALESIARHLDVTFDIDESGGYATVASGVVVDGLIRDEKVAAAASRVAAVQNVRDALLQRQRDFLKPPGLVADGRDMGTVVFPGAPVKLYITASAKERARRRYEQLKASGTDANLRALLSDIQARDQRDKERDSAPLRPADDAFVIDTTRMSVKEVIGCALEILRRRFPAR
ncbi:MAG: (d)CMP kinase [Lysobacterales bacterium]